MRYTIFKIFSKYSVGYKIYYKSKIFNREYQGIVPDHE